ncbi:MAG: hypothetical protein NTY04_03425 [Candidatus Staskawiczbacteria bacterium]|nr:hypothetical protein [Candidatus Staskawiczbacteria bacterium]
MPTNKDDEQILVIKSDIIFAKGKWQGLKKDNLDYYIDLIKENHEFQKRGAMEINPAFQQIVAYILFSFGTKFFAYKYIKNAYEKRLVNDNYQLGVGGHINPTDADNGDILEAGTMREWNEEVDFKGNFVSKKLVGIIKDESHDVEKVHVGLVYHFVGDSADIKIKETDKMEGKLFELKDIAENISHSPWMQIVYKEYLSKI